MDLAVSFSARWVVSYDPQVAEIWSSKDMLYSLDMPDKSS